jgi:CHAD domain-containing protein
MRDLFEIRNIVRRRIGKAARALRGRSPPSDASVHYARKQLKRARAGLRLLRDAVPRASYARENAELRDAARPLSLVRDASVMLDTLEGLRSPRARPGAGLGLRRALRGERLCLRRELLQSPGNRQRIVRSLVLARHRVGRWRPGGDERRVFRAGMKRVYRRGRKMLARVEADRSVENLHEFRKQVKYLGLAMEALESIEVRHLKKLAKRAESIADSLGDGHDLAVLREKITSLSPAVQDAPKTLLSRIERRLRNLEKKAVKRGKRLYGSRPKEFIARHFQLGARRST